jgi:hypothetical protein
MNKITVKCTEIQWDTDGDKRLLKKLPKNVILTIDDYYEGDDLDDTITDMLSDEYGFCLFGFNYEIINA